MVTVIALSLLFALNEAEYRAYNGEKPVGKMLVKKQRERDGFSMIRIEGNDQMIYQVDRSGFPVSLRYQRNGMLGPTQLEFDSSGAWVISPQGRKLIRKKPGISMSDQMIVWFNGSMPDKGDSATYQVFLGNRFELIQATYLGEMLVSFSQAQYKTHKVAIEIEGKRSEIMFDDRGFPIFITPNQARPAHKMLPYFVGAHHRDYLFLVNPKDHRSQG